jgi:nucleoside-diphosphate-sugar epimerase
VVGFTELQALVPLFRHAQPYIVAKVTIEELADPMNILVTGGTGFTGRHLVSRLLSEGHRVTVLDVGQTPVARELECAGARLVRGSVTDAATVDHATAGQDLVYHLASAFRDVFASNDVYRDVDVEGTRRVLDASFRAGARRVVHVSTQGVHGSIRNTPGDEDSAIAPRDSYCEAKYLAERVCREFIDRGEDVVIVRPTSIYGPGDTHGWLKLFRMVQKGRFLMIGDGRTLNHTVFVENVVDCLQLAAAAPHARGRTYLVGDDEATTLDRLVRLIAETLDVDLRMLRFPSYRLAWLGAAGVEFACKPIGVSPPIFRRRLSWFRTNRAFRIDRARRELGYEPRVGLREGLARTAAWYREQGLLDGAPAPADVSISRRIAV